MQPEIVFLNADLGTRPQFRQSPAFGFLCRFPISDWSKVQSCLEWGHVRGTVAAQSDAEQACWRRCS
jgi:hypothetical protein